MKKQDKILEMAKQYFCENKKINANTLSAFLDKYIWRLYDIYDKQCKRSDIMIELAEREIKYNDDDIEHILDRYEDYLIENGAWRDCLNEAISTYFED